jgi:hypothetical protein
MKGVRPKLYNLDFLLGFFIILALDEHFTYYLNMWYVEYFHEIPAIKTTYQIHFPMIGKQLSTDYFNYVIGVFFIPWVSQIYLALSAFNLASKDAKVLNENLLSRMKIFGLISIIFIIENFIVAPDFGQAISIYPIIIWMIILALLSIVYSKLGIKGVVGLLIISLSRWFLPVDQISNHFQEYVALHIHPNFEYDARIEYFLTSGCLGFVLGYIHYHLDDYKEKKDIGLMTVGIIMVLAYLATGPDFIGNTSNAYAHEHSFTNSLFGNIFIWGMEIFTISMFLYLEFKNIRIKFAPINWIGENSLIVFTFHRVFFVKLIAPISMFVGSMCGRTLSASSIEVFTYVFIAISMSWALKKLRLVKIIFPSKI